MATQDETYYANPAPLGLLGFGMTTILLNLHNTGIISLSIVIVAMGIALGGVAQIFAGLMEFKNKNLFGGIAFTSYGFFWLSLVLIWVNPFVDNGLTSADKTSLGFYLLFWGIYTFFMFLCALRHNTITKLVFSSLVLLFLLLAIADFTKNGTLTQIAGIVGIICGAFAMYSAVAQVVNTEYGKEVLRV